MKKSILCFFGFLFIVTMITAAELPTLQKADFDLWVATDGHDAAAGTADAPLATLAGSVNAVRKIRESNPNASVTVFFRGGTYRISETVTLENFNATSAKPILFRSAPGERAVFSGGKPVGSWSPLTESAVWQKADDAYRNRFDSAALDLILVAPLADLGIDDFGNPGVIGKRTEFFYDGVPQTLARWPNAGFAVAGKALGETRKEAWAHNGAEEPIFEGAPDQPRNWNAEKDAYLFGYWFWDWAESFEKLESVDSETGVIRLVDSENQGYGFKDGLRYYGFNLLCELNAPGEYFMDSDKKVLYWIPPCPEFCDFAVPRGSVVCFNKPFMVEIKNSSHVIFAGLEFTEGRSGAISVENGSDVLLADLTLSRFGGDVLTITGGEHHGVYASTLKTLGCGGIIISGGDRKTLTPAHHFIENCVVRDFSRIKRTYKPAILANGCGMKFAHNHFSESSSSAMRLEGNDFLAEFNRFDHLVKESDDQGGIDVFYNPSYRGNVIRWNYWEDIIGGTHCGAAAVRFDDMISGYTVFGNVFVHCGAVHFGAVQIHGGKDNIIENNVFLGARAAVSCSRWGERYYDAFKEGTRDSVILKKIYEEVDIRSELWQQRYPELAHITEDADRNHFIDNLIVNCDDLFLNDGGVNQLENNSELHLDAPKLTDILRPEFLARYGLKPIPFDQIGPTEDRFLKD